LGEPRLCDYVTIKNLVVELQKCSWWYISVCIESLSFAQSLELNIFVIVSPKREEMVVTA